MPVHGGGKVGLALEMDCLFRRHFAGFRGVVQREVGIFGGGECGLRSEA